MEYEGKFQGQPFDVGTGENISLNQMKDMVNEVFPEVKFEYRPPREGDVMCTQADITPLKGLGWTPKHDISQGISGCFEKLKGELS